MDIRIHNQAAERLLYDLGHTAPVMNGTVTEHTGGMFNKLIWLINLFTPLKKAKTAVNPKKTKPFMGGWYYSIVVGAVKDPDHGQHQGEELM